MSRMLASVAAFVALAIVANGTMTAEEVARVDVGSIVILEMTGELAAEYAKHTDSIKDGKIPDGLQISTSATIAQRLEDGRIRFEHTSHVVREGKTPRLVTLVATVDTAKLTLQTTPKGRPVYASPDDQKNGVEPKLTTKDTTTTRIHLSELKGVKLRIWTLEQSIGD